MSAVREEAKALLAAANAWRGSVDVMCEGPGAADVSALLQAAPELLATLIAEAEESEAAARASQQTSESAHRCVATVSDANEKLIAELAAAERRAVEAEAGAAAMRDALKWSKDLAGDARATMGRSIRHASEVLLNLDRDVDAALANPASRAILDRLAAAERERDAYKRAKAENDERFMLERDEARTERAAALKCYHEARAVLAALYETVSTVGPVGALPNTEEFGPEASHEADAIARAFAAVVAERDELRAENERLKGIVPELPPFPPEGGGLPRYGIRWNGPTAPLAVPMADGYWTPWHLADSLRAELEKERGGAQKTTESMEET